MANLTTNSPMSKNYEPMSYLDSGELFELLID